MHLHCNLKIIILISLLWLTLGMVSAQTADLDQLMKEAAKGTGIDKINAMAEICSFYYLRDPASGIKYGQHALLLSDSLNINKLKGKIFNNLGVCYLSLSEFDSAKYCFNKAFSESRIFNDSLEMGNALNRMGIVYEKQGIFDSSILMFQNALTIFKNLRNDERAGRLLENIGTIHLHRNEQKTAFTCFLESMEFFEKSGNEKYLPSLYLKIGRIYAESQDYENAMKWYEKGHQLSLKLGNFETSALIINAMGIMNSNQGKYEDALKNYLEVIVMEKKVNNKRLLLAVNGNIANIYSKTGNKSEALLYYKQALHIAEDLHYPLEIARQYTGIGSVYNSLNDFTTAVRNFEKALPVFEKSKAYPDLLLTLEAMIKASNGLNNYKQSVEYYEKYVSVKDSLNRNELNSALDSLKVKFDTEQTQQENILLAQKTEIQKKTISLQRIVVISSIITAVLLIGLTLIIFRNRQKIKHSNQLLEEKNHEISAKADELDLKNKRLVELSQFKDSMQSFLVHDLKNPLNNLLSIDTHEPFENKAEGIRQTGLQMLNIVLNLLDIGKYEENMMKPVFQDVSLIHVINKAFQQTRYIAEQKSVRLVVGNLNDFIVKADPEILTRVLTNLFTNAVKFSPSGGKITIIAEHQYENILKLIIKDEGEGISAGFQPYIFDKFSQDKVRHLGYAGSTGIGLTFCKMAIESHGGKIGVQPSDGKGAAFWFTLPLASTQSDIQANLEVFDSDATKTFTPFLSNEEKTYLAPFCEILRNTSIYQISDVKETLSFIDVKSVNIAKWKSLIGQALSDCNEIKYFELLNLDSNE